MEFLVAGKDRLQEFDVSSGSESQWMLVREICFMLPNRLGFDPEFASQASNVFYCLPQYTSSMCLAFALFLLLVCGLMTRGYRFQDHTFTIGTVGHSAVHMVDDGDSTIGTYSSGWWSIIRAYLRMGSASEEFSEGLSASQIQVFSCATIVPIPWFCNRLLAIHVFFNPCFE